MKKGKFVGVLLCATMAAVGCELFAEPQLSGVVKDLTGAPVAGVQVELENPPASAVTDGSGAYSLNYAPGTLTVLFSEPRCFIDRKVTVEISAEKGYRMEEVVLSPVVSREALAQCSSTAIAKDLSAFIRAAQEGDVEKVQIFIETGADINGSVNWKLTPLMEAVKAGRAQMVKMLIDAGANVNLGSETASGNPLFAAAASGNPEIVAMLIEAGAKLDAISQSQNTALWVAAWKGHLEIATMLVEAGANVNAKYMHDSPLSAACRSKSEEIAMLLLKNGADPNAWDKYHTTPIHHAAEAGNLKLVRALLDAGADVSVVDTGKKTALDKAMGAGNTEIVELLKAKGASPSGGG